MRFIAWTAVLTGNTQGNVISCRYTWCKKWNQISSFEKNILWGDALSKMIQMFTIKITKHKQIIKNNLSYQTLKN